MHQILRYGHVCRTVHEGDLQSCKEELTAIANGYTAKGYDVRLEWEAITVFKLGNYIFHFSIERTE